MQRINKAIESPRDPRDDLMIMKYLKFCLICAFLLMGLLNQSVFGQGVAITLLGDFPEGWQKHWIERSIFPKPPQNQFQLDSSKKHAPYEVVEDKGDAVLQMESEESATVLWRSVFIHPVSVGKIKWRWKVDRSLSGNKKEKQKIGDDYAARLLIVFEPHLVSWKTRALCYVWAGKEPVGSIYKNPYASSVGTIVVESGNKEAGKWVSEERNFVKDYEQVFGVSPEMISAAAIMVDTDNTQSSATAWFDDVVLEVWKPKVRTKENVSKNFRFY